MNDQLVHIFDNSTCLTKRQLKDYVTGIMGEEECHAAEVHLNSCPFCSDAVDGMMMHKDEAAQLLADLNPDFLKEHFAQAMPQVHLNAIAVPVDQPAARKKRKNNVRPFWRTTSVAAAVLFCTGLVWYYSYQKDVYRNVQVAKDETPVTHTPAPDNKMIAQTTSPAPSSRSPQNAGPSQPVTQMPLVPERKEIEPVPHDGDNVPAEKAVTAAVPAAAAPARQMADTTTYVAGYNPAATSNAALYNSQNALSGTQSYTSVQSDEARPFYGNSFRNLNTRQNNFSVDIKRQNRDEAGTSSNKHIARTSVPQTAKDSESEKTPADNLKVSGARTEGTVYVVDGVEARSKAKEETVLSKKGGAAAPDADDLYSSGDYKAALAAYNKDISSSNRVRRHYAVMGAARCYLKMGQKAKARQLLQGIVEEGGSQSRAAKKLLHKMEGDAQ